MTSSAAPEGEEGREAGEEQQDLWRWGEAQHCRFLPDKPITALSVAGNLARTPLAGEPGDQACFEYDNLDRQPLALLALLLAGSGVRLLKRRLRR